MQKSDAMHALQVNSQIAEANGMANHIRSASKATGVSFDYLMAQAGRESAFTSDAKSHVSSAAGLFQFTRSTWLQLIKRHGADHGLAEFAGQIERGPKGDYIVKDPEQRQQILALRRDPALSSLIAGEYARDNKHLLEKNLGRKIGSTELYLAHFLGPAGAVKLLRAQAENPDQPAALLVPNAAAKNKTMFYDNNHSPQSITALYDRVRQVMENPADPPRRQEPPAELALAALRYGDLPWADSSPEDLPDPQKLLSTVKLSIQAYTNGAKSADRISAPMPPMPARADRPTTSSAEPLGSLFKQLFG